MADGPRAESGGAARWSHAVRSREAAPSAWVVLLFMVCAACWSLVVPPFESPDEIGHARYVDFVRTQHRLPVPGEAAAGEAHQPPLHYLIAAGVAEGFGWEPVDVSAQRNPRFVWYGGDQIAKYLHAAGEHPPLSGSASTLHRLRLLSVLMGAATVALVCLAARRAGAPPGPAALIGAMAAFTPQFTFVAASLNNDNSANLASAACLAALMGLVASGGTRDPDDAPSTSRPARAWSLAGCAAGIALLAKFTTVTLLACGAAALWMGRRDGVRALRSRAAAFFVPALLLPAPLLAWNTWRWGDPFGAGAQLATLPQLVDRKSLLSPYFVTEFPRVLFRSFWGMFGWMSFPMPRWLDLLFVALTAAASIGLLRAARRQRLGAPHALAAAAVVVQIAQVTVYNMTFTQAQGRFLFPVIGPIMLLLWSGLSALWQGRDDAASLSGRAWPVFLACGLMAAGSLLLLRLWVAPAYAAAVAAP